MKKVVTIALLTLFSSLLHASERDTKQNLFKCVDSESLEVNQSCMEQAFELNTDMQKQSFNYAKLNDGLNENAMATMSFYPDKMLIEIVAHADAAEAGLASVSKYE